MSSESEPVDEIVAVDAIMVTLETIAETTDRKEFWVDNDIWTINHEYEQRLNQRKMKEPNQMRRRRELRWET